MRKPIRSETDVFHLAIGGAGLTGAALSLGTAVGPLGGATLFAAGVAGAVAWELSGHDPDRRRPLREAAAEGRREASAARWRVLVVANRTLQGDALATKLRRRGVDNCELRVVAPIVVSRVHYFASDVDHELAEARGRLDAALEWARAEGFHASGTVGDPNAALDAIEDELRQFAADEVLICTYPSGHSNWLETGIVKRLREELDISVTHVVVESERAPRAMQRL
jgi:GABA permease